MSMADAACPDAELLSLYVTEQLDEKRTERVRVHLLTCARCRDVVDGLNLTAVYISKDASTHKASPGNSDITEQDRVVDLSVLGQSPKQGALGRMGKYDILEVIGHGGMGVVFRAFDDQLRRTVAIKVLTRALASNETARRRFIREARAAAAINHLNVVTIHSVEEHEDSPFIVMEYIRGGSLRDLLRDKGPADATEIVRISAQIAAGLAAAHAQGVIHRDIKPGNIMLESGIERVKITDFGLARITVDNVELTTHEMPVGTPAYMSPEQVSAGKVDFRTDLFSLGCLMYTMASGSSPFRGDSAVQIAHKVCEHHPPKLRALNEENPEFLSEIVDRLLQKKPEHRYQSAQELASVLKRHLSAINLARTDEMTQTLHKQPIYSRRKSLWKWLAPLLILLVVAGITGIWLSTRKPDSPQLASGGKPESSQRPSDSITVASNGDADVQSIQEALTRAVPGCEIVVTDDAVYHESLLIDDAARWRDVRIVSPSGATIAPPEQAYAAVIIADTPGVRLSGFRIVPNSKQHAVMITGRCPGVTISELKIDEPSIWAQIFVAKQASGAKDRPLTIQDSSFVVGQLGTVIQGDSDSPISFVELRNNRFAGSGTHVQVNRSVRQLHVTGNIFLGGGIALNLSVPESSDVSIKNNTFYHAGEELPAATWLHLPSTPGDVSGAEVESNMIVGNLDIRCKGGLSPFSRQWSFRNNVCAPDSGLDRQRLQPLVEFVDEIQFKSTDPQSADFLRPVDSSPLTDVDDEGRYPGAREPAGAAKE